MRKQDLDFPGIAQVMRSFSAGYWQAWERSVDHHSRLIWASILEFQRVTQLPEAPASAELRSATWPVPCLAEGVLRRRYS
jgi:hypothetical protein